MGEKWLKNFLEFFSWAFFEPFLPHAWDCFFQTTKNYKFSLYPFLTFFSTRVLENHLGG